MIFQMQCEQNLPLVPAPEQSKMHSIDKQCWRQVMNAMQTLNITNAPACKGTDLSCSHPSELLRPEPPACSQGHL